MTVSAHDVARELRMRLPGAGDVKIHKLLYYCQGWHLAWTAEPMFREHVESWDMGPVVADLWHDEGKGRNRPASRTLDASALGTVGYVVARYGRLTGRDLIHLSHAEDPWRVTSDDPTRTIIDHALMRDFFRSDEEVAALDALADLALADEAVRHGVEMGTRRAAVEPAAIPDDPNEIERRLAQHRG